MAGEEGYQALEIVQGVYQSCRTGEKVKFGGPRMHAHAREWKRVIAVLQLFFDSDTSVLRRDRRSHHGDALTQKQPEIRPGN